MKAAMHMPVVLAVGTALLLQGCSYAISSAVSRNADRSLTFQQLQADPARFTGKTVILGGIMAGIHTVKTGTTIEIVQKELDYWGKPRRTVRTGGRFLVFTASRLDPLVYSPGRDLTVAGEVTGTEEKGLGEAGIPYPLVHAVEMKLWPREPQARDSPTWLDPLYDPALPQDKFGY